VEPWLFLGVVVIFLASLPIEVRLWRAGRMSDRTLTVLILGRFPVLVAVFSLAVGLSPGSMAVLVAVTALPGLALHPWILGIVRERPRA
jgi:hypothetical protein